MLRPYNWMRRLIELGTEEREEAMRKETAAQAAVSGLSFPLFT